MESLAQLTTRLEAALSGPRGDDIRDKLRELDIPVYGLTVGELADLKDLEEKLGPLY